MVELHALYENGEFRFSEPVDPSRLKDSRVKVVVTVAKGIHQALSREEQEDLRKGMLAANPAELKLKIEHEAGGDRDGAAQRRQSAEDKLRAYWEMKGGPPADQQERLLAKLAQVSRPLSRKTGTNRNGTQPPLLKDTTLSFNSEDLVQMNHPCPVTGWRVSRSYSFLSCAIAVSICPSLASSRSCWSAGGPPFNSQ